jgi:hypothetical protein
MSDDYRALSGKLTAVLHYDVGELNVRRDLLATGLQATHEGVKVEVRFPSASGAFENQPVALPRAVTGSHGTAGDVGQVAHVRVLQVRVELNRELGDEGSGNAELVLIRDAEPVGNWAVRKLLDWARTYDRQPWLAPPHVRPALCGPAVLMNDAGEVSNPYPVRGGVLVLQTPEESPDGDLRNALTAKPPPEPESLLAEAQWAVWPTNDPDTKRAVLLAAIALEVKTPESLLASADGLSRALLRKLYERFDETPMSVTFQLTDLAEVILGASLKTEDGRLAKGVRKLYDLRNGIAHRGLTPSVNEARAGVSAAERAFAWLDQRVAAC